MKSRTIEVNGVDVTCYEDGSVEKINRNTGAIVRGKGFSSIREYMLINIGGKTEAVHRIICTAFHGLSEGKEVDHIDGYKKNNRPSNLRWVTHQQNNRGYNKKRAGCSSDYRGVHFDKPQSRWRAGICENGRTKHLGSFNCEMEAAHAYNVAAINAGYSAEALNVLK
jgi:hypothetical protein